MPALITSWHSQYLCTYLLPVFSLECSPVGVRLVLFTVVSLAFGRCSINISWMDWWMDGWMNHQGSVRDKCYRVGEKSNLSQRNLLRRGEAWDGLCRIGKIQKVWDCEGKKRGLSTEVRQPAPAHVGDLRAGPSASGQKQTPSLLQAGPVDCRPSRPLWK